MSSILDIDLDYFNLIKNPEQKLLELLNWSNCPIAFIVEKHNKAYSRWKDRVKRGTLTPPSHILHVDEHHDMMDQRKNANIANFMFHAMRVIKHIIIYQEIMNEKINRSQNHSLPRTSPNCCYIR
ncbi:MAG: hypothetical protein HOG03_22350 [Desulfobacula sp.]|jgi:hypothetical protein|uniref:hypothetical protein n=1 Tax=Desulfobacula sp. TaxID=2593537 RepID=UPI001E00AF07|nr:hypothetical protein [Desulfobacula sp.]MBT5970470.1 hypothetical protein [Desulfobacula sp.]MBT6339974.1 hypothetical protein [Desulfobacula sp.]MBT6751633.1 hypothetical protein [Desulfobacula sp.]